MTGPRSCLGLGFTVLLLSAATARPAQFPLSGVPYVSGQDVSPTFEGWEANADGTFTFYYGYFNRNAQEQLDVAVGPDNAFDDGEADRGQPSHFYSGRRWFVFAVAVPANWPKEKRLVWTLKTQGRTNQAKGWLQPEWELDRALIAMNAGRDPFLRGSTGSPQGAGHQPPQLTVGPDQTITLPANAVLTAHSTDDGIPKPPSRPPRRARQRPEGVQVRWIFYRGPAAPRFQPDASPVVYGKPLDSETSVTFTTPGVYRLRAIATDGALFSTRDVNVTVKPGAQP
jgi:hypothetical protein